MNGDLFPEVRTDTEAVPDERYTPAWLYLPLAQEFRFTLDACATRESAKCIRFYDEKQDGLAQSWTGERVWCNPPYSAIPRWVAKAWRERTDSCVMLLPAWTDREWWAEWVEPYRDGGQALGGKLLSTRFLRGRVPFGHPGNPEGVGVGSPSFFSVLLIWRPCP